VIGEARSAEDSVAATADRDPVERRILILAPIGRTAPLAQTILESAGMACEVCPTMAELCAELDRGAGAALLLGEAVSAERDIRKLAVALQTQPSWSELPIAVFVADLERTAPSFRFLSKLTSGRSIVVLERPIRAPSLVSLMTSLLQARDRQYDVRDLMAELGRARRVAEEANRAKSDFLAMMSHELRTPLTAIIGFGDLLYEGISGPLGELPRSQIGRIRQGARHLLALIEDILSYSRIEAGKQELSIETVNVGDLARDAAGVVEPLATKKGLALRVSVPDVRVAIATDARKLRQILLNLLGNAVKFTERGEVVLTVEHGADGGVAFRVRDTGGGIAPTHLERIFQPFEQVDTSLANRHQGTGLGLGLSRKLAHLLGGELSVESELGVGSTFTLLLPARLAAPTGTATER
jgi:signal transduction histidine kinase